MTFQMLQQSPGDKQQLLVRNIISLHFNLLVSFEHNDPPSFYTDPVSLKEEISSLEETKNIRNYLR